MKFRDFACDYCVEADNKEIMINHLNHTEYTSFNLAQSQVVITIIRWNDRRVLNQIKKNYAFSHDDSDVINTVKLTQVLPSLEPFTYCWLRLLSREFRIFTRPVRNMFFWH